jgi:predicted  nucleic acid-binding Zn-ribbon protein
MALQKHYGMLAELPGVKQTLASAGQQISETREKLSQWATEQDALKDQVAKLEGATANQLKAVSRQAQQTRDTVTNWVRLELDRRDGAFASRISRLETDHRNEVARMQTELEQIKESVVQQRTRLAAAENNALSDKELAHQKLADVNGRIEYGQREARDLARSLEVRRLDFEVTKDHNRQLAPGIWLGVTKIDVAHRRVSGWMWIMPDRKTVWLRQQGALQPVIYYSSADGKRREVVFTHVTKDSAVGYLLLPAEASAIAKAAAPGEIAAVIR